MTKERDISKRDNSHKVDLKRQRYDEKDALKKAKLSIQIAKYALLAFILTPKGVAFGLICIVILIIAILNPELLAPLIQSLASFTE